MNFDPDADTKSGNLNYSDPFEDQYSLKDILYMLQQLSPEYYRDVEENYFLIQEVFSNSVLGWAASGQLATDHKHIDL